MRKFGKENKSLVFGSAYYRQIIGHNFLNGLITKIGLSEYLPPWFRIVHFWKLICELLTPTEKKVDKKVMKALHA